MYEYHLLDKTESKKKHKCSLVFIHCSKCQMHIHLVQQEKQSSRNAKKYLSDQNRTRRFLSIYKVQTDRKRQCLLLVTKLRTLSYPFQFINTTSLYLQNIICDVGSYYYCVLYYHQFLYIKYITHYTTTSTIYVLMCHIDMQKNKN